MRKMIYADNAATTKLDIDAFEAMKPFLLYDFSNPSQPYSFSRNSKKALKEARIKIANCINAEPDEIYFTSGGSESDNWAIKGFGKNNTKKTIITSSIEHHAILNACNSIFKSFNCQIIYLPVTKYGEIEINTLEKALKEDTDDYSNTLVSIMFANNEIGTLQKIKELANVAHKYGAVFHSDAVQAVGHVPIDVKELGVDILSASAHKFNGPKGVGFLYLKNGVFLNSLIDGGNQEKSMRAGTENVASIVGMGKALEICCSHIEENSKYIFSLENELLSKLDEYQIDYIRNGSQNRIPGNISLSFLGFEGEAILHCLDLMGICISTGSACDSVNTQISHVLKAIHLDNRYAKGTVRISLNHENTFDDIAHIACSLKKILNK